MVIKDTKKNKNRSRESNPENKKLHNTSDSNLFIVAIIACSASLETLKTFLIHADENPEIAFVVVYNLSDESKNVLTNILKLYTKIPVSIVENEMVVEGNHIYLLPLNQKLYIQIQKLFLTAEKLNEELLINFFLTSLATDLGQKAVCVILVDKGNDSASGLKAIREKNGLVISHSNNKNL